MAFSCVWRPVDMLQDSFVPHKDIPAETSASRAITSSSVSVAM
jgi:hypothetical protein